MILKGSIANLGNLYVLNLKAMNCQTGDLLATAASKAEKRENVLQALSQIAASLRAQLGESLPSIQRFDKPLEEATTSSLEALQAFTHGWRMQQLEEGDFAAVPFLRRTVELDPSFALAHAALATVYGNLGQVSLQMSPDCTKVIVGGADGIRTHDLLDAIEARSQLRHGPTGRILAYHIRCFALT